MNRFLASTFLFVTLSACGAWVLKYDREASHLIAAQIELGKEGTVISTLKHLADKHNFQVVVQDKSSHEENTFNVIMRKRAVSATCTNFPVDYLQCGFHKSVHEKHRPSDLELDTLVKDFIARLDAINGVRVVPD